jgi:exodeoxyribonuclease VII large subunit
MEIYSVSEINSYIKEKFAQDRLLAKVMVSGELSNFKLHYSGHCYFTLKDKNAAIRGVMFKSRAQMLKFKPADGMKVVVGGSVSVYERDGQYQLYADVMLPEGAGELSLAYEQLKKRLSEEGLFDDALKKALPLFPKKIGVVTSPTGAVLRDIFKVAKRRSPSVEIDLYPVPVQGEGAAEKIARGIDFFNRLHAVDVIIVGRGGGSLEDLWAFNEEIVVRSIFKSKIPVISAVGHQTDFTLCDFVSDVRAATPSHAAELAVPDKAEYLRHMQNLYLRLNAAEKNIMREKQCRLELCANSRYLKEPQFFLKDKRQQLDGLHDSLNRAKDIILERKKQRLFEFTGKLSVLNPLSVLARGYSLVKGENGKTLRSINDVQENSRVSVAMADGSFTATVDKVDKADKIDKAEITLK